MNGHLAKPIDEQELIATLNKYLEVGVKTQAQSTTDSDGIPETLYGVELDKLKRQFKTNDKVAMLLKSFLASVLSAEGFNALDVNSSEFDKALHALKGASGNLHISDLSQMCLQIEEKKRGGEPFQEELNGMLTELEAVREAIEKAYS